MKNDLIWKEKWFHSTHKTHYLYRYPYGLASLSIFTSDSTRASERDYVLGILYQFLSHRCQLINWYGLLLVTWNQQTLTKITRWPLPNICFILRARAFLKNDDMLYNVPANNFELVVELAQVESYSLGGVSTIMDIVWGVDSGLVLKNFPDHKSNLISIGNSQTKNKIFVIGFIDFNKMVFNLCRVKFVHNHVVNGSDTNWVLLFPIEKPFGLDQMTSPVWLLIQVSMVR